MCGRYADHVTWSERWAAILGAWPEEVSPSFNRAPTQTAAVFTREGGRAMRWGLVPAWSKEPTTRYATFNARIEEVAGKPAYRAAWRAGRRCLLPALGYYEWQRIGEVKQPFFIHAADGAPLFLAGLWEEWRREGQSLTSCTILTREAAAGIAHIHPRMPVCVGLDCLREWLEGPAQSGREIALRGESDGLAFHPVSTFVNHARNDGPRCVAPLRST